MSCVGLSPRTHLEVSNANAPPPYQKRTSHHHTNEPRTAHLVFATRRTWRSSASSASQLTHTTRSGVPAPPSPMAKRPTAAETTGVASSIQQATSSASNSTARAVSQRIQDTFTSAQAVAPRLMELKRAVEQRKLNAFTPFIPDAWENLLRSANLVHKYPSIVNNMRFGFDIGVPYITTTRIPLSSASLLEHGEEFHRIIENEFRSKRYLGPFTRAQVEELIGPFQCSPTGSVPAFFWHKIFKKRVKNDLLL